MTTLTDPLQIAAFCMQNREYATLMLDKADSEESLLKFVRVMWPVLEPDRQFVSGMPIEAMCDHLEAVHHGQIKKLLMNVPPGTSKSLLTGVFFPAWRWGPKNSPSLRFMSWSYSEKLTVRDNRKLRALVTSTRYQQMWGDRVRLLDEQNQKVRFDTTKTGWSIASSIGGVGTGERADLLRIDDPNSVMESESDLRRESANQFMTEVLPTRINDSEKSATIVITQRTHEHDVSGMLLSSELGFEHLCIPMRYEKDHPYRRKTVIGWVDPRSEEGELMWPERFSERYLRDELEPALSAWGGNYSIAGQLQQRPAPRGGGMFQKKHWQLVDAKDVPSGGTVVRGWDLAASIGKASAYTAGVKMMRAVDGRIFIIDVHRFRGTPMDVEAAMMMCATMDGRGVYVDVPQDPGQAGVSQKHALARLLHGFVVSFSPESGSKEDRAKPLAAQVEAGNVYLVRAAWNDPFTAEGAVFPSGQYKDQVDAATRAYGKLLSIRTRVPVPVAPRFFAPETAGDDE